MPRASLAALAFIALPFTALPFTGCKGGGGPAAGTGPRIVMTLPSDVDGESVDLHGFEGRVLIVHVFTTWALPAQDDAQRLVAAFGDRSDVAIVGVALDPQGAVVVAPWRRGMNVSYPIALADDKTRGGASALGSTRAVPFTLLFDREGRLAWRRDRPLAAPGIAELERRVGALAR